MSTLTIQRAQGRAIYTYTNLFRGNFRDHDMMAGDGSSGRSEYVAKRRAFNRAEAILYLHQDKFFCFVTLTYKDQHHDYERIKNDIKNYFTRRGITYVAVVERHKSGNFHIHAITSELPDLYRSDYFDKRGNPQVKWAPWERNIGITDVKFISGTDDRFRIHKYIFKYISKSERVGGRYFLKSRDLKIGRYSMISTEDVFLMPEHNRNPIDFETYNEYNGDNYNLIVERTYYGRKEYKN